jgi:hypothetical protein
MEPVVDHIEYTPAGYYALFFKDPEGIKYEIVCIDPMTADSVAADR